MRISYPMGDFDTAEMMDINEKRVSLIEKKDKKWHCKVCGKTIKQICAIKNHVETHIDGISVDCSVCGKSYRSKQTLLLMNLADNIVLYLFSQDLSGW